MVNCALAACVWSFISGQDQAGNSVYLAAGPLHCTESNKETVSTALQDMAHKLNVEHGAPWKCSTESLLKLIKNRK